MSVSGIDHINIDTNRLSETVEFYAGILGLESRTKPSGINGVWLYLAENAIVHVNEISDDRSTMPTGSFNHIAFAADDVDALVDALSAGGYEHRVAHRPDLGVTQIFTTDPNGLAVELNVKSDRHPEPR